MDEQKKHLEDSAGYLEKKYKDQITQLEQTI